MLEEVRFLLNFKMDAQSPMTLILVGQSELWDRLGLQAYAAIRQRIDLQCKLPHYDRSQVGDYIMRHLAYAGAENDIFSDGAIEEVLVQGFKKVRSYPTNYTLSMPLNQISYLAIQQQ
jgi:general secretion pathway protein A